MAIQAHPLRRQVVEEMHLRPTLQVAIPGVVIQTVRLVSQGERTAEIDAILPLSEDCADRDARHLKGLLPQGVRFAWERHSEGSTTTLVLPTSIDASRADGATAWIESLPGQVMRATRIEFVEHDAAGLIMLERFVTSDLVAGQIGSARFWSDFRIHEGGYGLIIIAANDEDRARLSRRVQELQELGNYRNLALMGLALVRNTGDELARIEHEIAEASGALLVNDGSDEVLLGTLTALAAQTAAFSSTAGYRLSATRAYGQIVVDRLGELAAEPIEGFQTLQGFTDRRLLPALRTCEAFRRRIETASTSLERATSLLSTRIELRLAHQNVALLQPVERSSSLQLHLQRLVEGLSIVALSYYSLGLLEMVLKGLWRHHILAIAPGTLLAVAVVPMLIVFAMLLRWHTRRLHIRGARAR